MQGTISLHITYVPPGGVVDKKDGKSEEPIDSQEDDEDEDHDDDDDGHEDDHDMSKKEGKRRGKISSRRRLTRKWSDKIKDFQVI